MVLGLDVGKEKIAYAVLKDNKIVKKGILRDRNKILDLIEEYKIKKVVMEHTGVYSIMIHKFIQDNVKDIIIVYLNSYSADQIRRIFFRNKKEDLLDAEIIAKSVYFEDLLNSFKINNFVLEIMVLVRQHKEISKMLMKTKQIINSDKDFGLEYSSLEKLRENLERTKKQIEKDIKLLIKGTKYEQLVKVNGINYVSLAYFIYYVKDIKRFPTVWKFLAYCGVAPITYSSGSFNIKRTTSKVNKDLKRILYMASVGLLRNKNYREIYDKKIKEGKHHFVAISHVAKRIAKKLYKEWKKLESY